jgi:hypothetical protein
MHDTYPIASASGPENIWVTATPSGILPSQPPQSVSLMFLVFKQPSLYKEFTMIQKFEVKREPMGETKCHIQVHLNQFMSTPCNAPAFVCDVVRQLLERISSGVTITNFHFETTGSPVMEFHWKEKK